MKRYILLLLITAFLFPGKIHGDTNSVEVISLNHRTVEEVIPVLRPCVGSEGVISGMNNQLIVQTTAARLERIKEIIARIDTPLRQLIITVAQNVTREQLERIAAASGKITISNNNRLTISDERGDRTGRVEYSRDEDTLKVQGQSSTGIAQTADIQRLRILEGSQALIKIGSSIPLPERTVVRNTNGVTVMGSSRYHDVTSGFYVLPRIVGDGVILEISPQRSTLGKEKSIDYQSATTRVKGQLGKWIELGSIQQRQDDKGSKIWSGSKEKASERRGIFLKVEEIE
ncbi:MAG: hypothetical protein JSU80_04060 [Deltaproteobacteria bacterium]|nr:MAG: hypothetical protein JSU80_04060 [Deltaproteobacteria bacterium]